MAKSRPVVDLIIPGLLNLPLYEFAGESLPSSTPYLHKLLRFALQQPNRAIDIDSILISLLDLKQPALPYAHALNQGSAKSQLLFKPVYLKSDINNAIVFPVDFNDEVDILINDLSNYFKVDCDIKKWPDNTWSMSLHSIDPPLHMPHYLTALGKKVTHYLQQGRTNLDWFRLFNEMQMFLYQHEINQARQQKGMVMINSLWCWGADSYHGEKRADLQWFSDDPLMQSLGHLYAGKSSELSSFRIEQIDSQAMLIDLSILKALKGNSEQDLMPLLNEIEQKYLKPVLESSSCKLVLHTAGHLNLHYNHLNAMKFWKKKVSLQSFIP